MKAFRIVRRMAGHPFDTQAAIARDLEISRDALVRLNRVLRQSDLAQQLMLQHGHAAKYWQNTIMPIVRSGASTAARRLEVRHPFRVGLYPGVSCMFSCTFCGRHRDARYAPEHAASGNALFDAMLRAAPADDPYTFYISGGLEPLTNPGLGALVCAGAARGFKLSLYTNGFYLTQAGYALQGRYFLPAILGVASLVLSHRVPLARYALLAGVIVVNLLLA